jgi:CubicO group peptidase (beta-lactamase class C family)
MRKPTILMMICLMLVLSVGGQVPNAPNATKAPTSEADKQTTANIPSSGVHELTATDAEAFLDGVIPLQLAQQDIAGATVSIVKDGKLLFAKGYGYRDVAQKQPVIADETLFRPGSISKLFTWTAVMQLYEQGKLDLDKDINSYLDFKIPDAFNQPITLKNVMTHTAGFEEQTKDLFSYDQTAPNLGEYLKNHIPQRIFPPGKVPAYSNYATALAGYIVERVSGQRFNDYITEHIFKPLGMNRSTFAQPLPPELAPLMSKGYLLASDPPKPFEIIGPFPAGSLSTTATDMAKFMLAHLQDGRLGDAQILKPETARLMHSRLFALDPSAKAMAYGFYEETSNNHRIIGHGGDTVLFHSDLHLILDAGVGFFVSYNSAGRNQISPRTVLWKAFLDRYFPYSPPDQPTLDTAKQDAAKVAGTYMISRRGEGSFVKLLGLLGEAKVTVNEDNTISVSGLTETNGKPKRWREIAPLTFRDVNGEDVLVFKPDESGRMQIILPYPFMIYQRVGLWQNRNLLLTVAGASLFVMLLTLVLWFVAWLVRRHYGRKLELTTWEWRLRLLVRIVFALDLIFIVAFLIFGVQASSHYELLSDAGNRWLRLIQIIGVIGAIGTLIVFANAVHAWLSSRYPIWGKLQATLFALACLGFLWLVFAGHLLRFTSNF